MLKHQFSARAFADDMRVLRRRNPRGDSVGTPERGIQAVSLSSFENAWPQIQCTHYLHDGSSWLTKLHRCGQTRERHRRLANWNLALAIWRIDPQRASPFGYR